MNARNSNNVIVPQSFVGLLEPPGDGLDVTVVLFDDLVLHAELPIRIHCSLFRHQIAHVSIGGKDFEVPAQVFLDGFGLGWRFHDDQIHN